MITVLFYATVKEGNVQTFHDHVVRSLNLWQFVEG